jgi:hypothetical protein
MEWVFSAIIGVMPTIRKDPHEQKQRTWNLQNGITLTIHYAASKPPTIGAIEEFLSKAMADFKERRDKLHEQTYNGGPWESYAIDGRKIRGTGVLVHTGDDTGNHLSTDLWVKSIIAAYTAATTVMDMMPQLDAYRAQANGWLVEVVAALDKRGGDLDAFDLILKRTSS